MKPRESMMQRRVTYPGPKVGSIRKQLEVMDVGARLYLEVLTMEKYKTVQRSIGVLLTPKRRPECMRDWAFSNQVFTAVSHSHVGAVRYLVCIERTK